MSDPFVFRGIDGTTGDYVTVPMTAEDLAGLAQLEPRDPEFERGLVQLKTYLAQRKQRRTLKFGVDPLDLAQSGWGVIFAKDAGDGVREALNPLLKQRQIVAGSVKSHYYQEYTGKRAYQPGMSTQQFLAKRGAGADFVDPDTMPYYLLLVGSPEEIPFHFQYQLGARYAVGRIHFDSVKDYESYAQSVVQAEKPRQVRLPRRLTFFGVENPGDGATQRGLRELIEPLLEGLKGQGDGWDIQTVLREEATWARLGRLLDGKETPGLLFTHSHGMAFEPGDKRQEKLQGALLCRDWQGPGTKVRREHYFAGEDVGDVSLLGMIAVHFACFSAGTPEWDNFAHPSTAEELKSFGEELSAPRPLGTRKAQRPLISSLPRQLLSLPKGGALAVLGHIDRALSWSYTTWERGNETPLMGDMLHRLLAGVPVGHAIEGLRRRYTTLAADLALALDRAEPATRSLDPLELSYMWRASTDARNFVILGDPAVRVLGDGGRRRGRR